MQFIPQEQIVGMPFARQLLRLPGLAVNYEGICRDGEAIFGVLQFAVLNKCVAAARAAFPVFSNSRPSCLGEGTFLCSREEPPRPGPSFVQVSS